MQLLRREGDVFMWCSDKLRLARGVAEGLAYLHERRVPLIHRDLRSKCILVTDKGSAKISDFSACSSQWTPGEQLTEGIGTPYWTAPEVLEGAMYNEQADIYSFGVVLTELDTTQLPYFDLRDQRGGKLTPFHILRKVVQGTLQPSLSESCPATIASLAKACLARDPHRRPTARQAWQVLQDAQLEDDDQGYADLEGCVASRGWKKEYAL